MSKMENWDILLIDKSASMLPNITKIKEGFNKLVTEQKNQGSINRFTVVGFNSFVKIMKNEKFPDVSYLEETDLVLKGSTALLDAMGNVYDMINSNKKVNNGEYKTVNITIITDGFENSSKFYTLEDLDEKKKLLDEKINIVTLFIGTDYNCIKKNILELHVTQAVNCDGDIPAAFRIISQSMSDTRESSLAPEGTKLFLKRNFSEFNPLQ
jgi:uncharacterized protein YegL